MGRPSNGVLSVGYLDVALLVGWDLRVKTDQHVHNTPWDLLVGCLLTQILTRLSSYGIHG